MPDVSNDPPEFERLVVEERTTGGRNRRPSRRPVAVRAGLAVGAVAVGAAVATLLFVARTGDDAAAPDDIDTDTTAPSTTEPPLATLAPMSGVYPAGWAVVDVRGNTPELGADGVADGDAAGWSSWSMPVPAPLDELTQPVEVVALSADGVLHRIEFPSGRALSRPVPVTAATGAIALTDDAIAVPQPGAVLLAAADGPLMLWDTRVAEVPDVVSAGSWLLVSPGGRPGQPDRRWRLDVDGTRTDITDVPLAAVLPWDPGFLMSGELVGDDGGEVIAIDVDGDRRPIGEGRLAGSGRHHAIIRICESEECRYDVVDAGTGVSTAAPLDVLDAYRFFDTSVRVSPDGRFVQYVDWRRERPTSRIIDTIDGSTLDIGDRNDIRSADAWATNSSGVFVVGDDGIVFRSVDGRER